jgi:hypothetical protein
MKNGKLKARTGKTAEAQRRREMIVIVDVKTGDKTCI